MPMKSLEWHRCWKRFPIRIVYCSRNPFFATGANEQIGFRHARKREIRFQILFLVLTGPLGVRFNQAVDRLSNIPTTTIVGAHMQS